MVWQRRPVVLKGPISRLLLDDIKICHTVEDLTKRSISFASIKYGDLPFESLQESENRKKKNKKKNEKSKSKKLSQHHHSIK